jgi:hypothetical protein
MRLKEVKVLTTQLCQQPIANGGLGQIRHAREKIDKVGVFAARGGSRTGYTGRERRFKRVVWMKAIPRQMCGFVHFGETLSQPWRWLWVHGTAGGGTQDVDNGGLRPRI